MLCLFGLQEGETPLIKATKMRNIEIVELLLDKGAKVSAVDKVLFKAHAVLVLFLECVLIFSVSSN